MFHTRLKALREQKHLSQEQLAELLGVKQQTIGKWENKLTVPRLPMLQKIATIFNVTIDYVMGESDNPHGSPFTGQVDGQFLTFAPEQIKPEELALLEAYRKASDRDKNIIDAILKPSVRDKGKEVG